MTRYSLKTFLSDNSVRNTLPKQVYHYICKNDKVTKNDLLLHTNVTQTTLARIIDTLLSHQFIKESGFGKSSGGRPPILYEATKSAGYVIGIELSRAQTTVVILNTHFQLIKKESFTMTKKDEPTVVLQKIIAIIRTMLKNGNIYEEDVLGIGVGTVGPLNREKGIVYNPESFLAPNWKNVKIKKQLQRAFSIPIYVEDGASSAVIAESAYQETPYKNILYCVTGYGIRFGIMKDERIFIRRQNNVDTYGHMIVQAGGRKCICGKRGCVAAYATYSAMVAQYKKLTNEQDPITLPTFTKKIKSGDSIARDVMLEAAYYYGIGIANIALLFQPELIVLHGNLVYDISAYYEAVVHTVKKYVGSSDMIFRKGSLGSDAIAIGASIHAFQSYFN